MDHTHIVQAGELDRYSGTRDSEAVIPELIYLLVKQSVPNTSICRIPYGDAVNQPGWDGLVEAEDAFLEFVPSGRSYWEIGTGANPQAKATADFSKRTKELSPQDRAKASYVFVTSRSAASGGWNEPAQADWLEKRKDTGWKHIRIIDGVKLADWLREFPAVGQWMAKKIGLTSTLGGISTPREHWEIILAQTPPEDPPLPPKLFTEGRDNACNALQALFEGESQKLLLFAESPQDVTDFVAAYINTLEPVSTQQYSNKCLFISEEDAWRSVVETRKPHVLVADPRLNLESEERADLQTIATRKGHSVIIPICGAWSGGNPEIIKLRSPSQSQIEAVLTEGGYSTNRAQELSRIGGERISALRRYLHGLGTIPPYGTWENARLFAQAGLLGKWDGKNTADRAALEHLLGKTYGEWIETLRPDALRSNSPLIQRDEKWRFVARGEAWGALGNRIVDDDLDKLQEVAVAVLGERNPEFDLPKEKRYAASIHGKQLEHSRYLREGLAETLALIGSQSKMLSSCSHGKAESTAVLTIRQLLSHADWERWASLNSLLPLLAEAAPDEFLDAVETALIDLEKSPFHQIFAEEGTGSIGGTNYMTGLLWALESLAWHPDYLSRVTVALSDIASIDPGGNWANRPINSLTDIFLPWHVQTTASLENRKTAIETILREQPEIGWKLLLSLLPHSHGFTSGCHQPIWRDYVPSNWKNNVLISEYWEQISVYTELAASLAKTNIEKLEELIEHLPDLTGTARDNLLKHLASDEVARLSESDRLPIWEKLNHLVHKHTKYADAKWALPEESVKEIESIANKIAPQAPEFKYHCLFSNNDFDFFDEQGDYDNQRKRLEETRQDAVQQIHQLGGIQAVLNFAQTVAMPYKVGFSLGALETGDIETEILPSLLAPNNEVEKLITSGFVLRRFLILHWTWVDQVLESSWDANQKSAFLLLLPFEDGIWSRVDTHLGKENEHLYWQHANVNPYGANVDITRAIEKLIEHNRPVAAVNCISSTVKDKSIFNEDLAVKALLTALKTADTSDQLDQYWTVEVIKRLQKSSSVNQSDLFTIEWNFLPWLDRFSSGSPVTLEKQLASDPKFFAEVISLVFRSKNEPKSETEPDEKAKRLAQNAYKLLTEWKVCPGNLSDGTFDATALKSWLEAVQQITRETGHNEVAQIQIGHILAYAPPDPDGLWIHNAVASELNARDAGEMRSGFTTELFNQRGVHTFSAGEEERKLAQQNREKAEALNNKGYSRFATAMREFAETYERQAEREASRDPLDY